MFLKPFKKLAARVLSGLNTPAGFSNITYLTKVKDKNSLYYSADLAVLINVKFLGFNLKNKSATSIKCTG